jgi:DNA ligase-associated metallophosphoesterase
MSSIAFNYNGMELTLLPEKAIWIDDLQILLLADIHLGKASHFRKSGIPIPERIHDLDYQRLGKLIQGYSPKNVYFLGDLFHSFWNEQWEDLGSFLSQFSESTFHLVLGNHDILPAKKYQDTNLQVYRNAVMLRSLLLSHEPTAPPTGLLNVCGHIHPGILLKGKAKQSVRIPCFHYSEDILVMPSFGNFTGLFPITRKNTDYVWGIAEDRVIPILSPKVIG